MNGTGRGHESGCREGWDLIESGSARQTSGEIAIAAGYERWRGCVRRGDEGWEIGQGSCIPANAPSVVGQTSPQRSSAEVEGD